MSEVEVSNSSVVLSQNPEGPRLWLRVGGAARRQVRVNPAQAALAQPVFLGFMTSDVRAAAGRLRVRGISLLSEVEHHDWGGTDVLVADADGNAIQIFQFDEPRRFGAERR